MMKIFRKLIWLLFLFSFWGNFSAHAQDTSGVVIDGVAAVVGGKIIMYSDVESQYLQYRLQSGVQGTASDIKCKILENMILQKLLYNQAELDSLTVSPDEVSGELDRRFKYFINQFGSQEKLEKYYNKSVEQFKAELSDVIEEQIMIEKAQQKITENVKVTPSEVKNFFKEIPPDSIPLVPAEVELSHIVKNPPISATEKIIVKERLRGLRDRILKGENFGALAALYSEDPGSAKNGGEVGLHGRGELYPPYEAVAFKLKPGEISDIVETEAGFHIIQLIERRGDFINTRHILLMPKISDADLNRSRAILDSISGLIKDKKYTFEEAASRFSDDPSRINGGIMINPYTGNSRFQPDQMDPRLFSVVNRLEVGAFSNPTLLDDEKGTKAYRLILLKVKTTPHKANLTDDYDQIQQWALADKNQRVLKNWMQTKVKNTYVKTDSEYEECSGIKDINKATGSSY